MASPAVPTYKVILLGTIDVGKTSLIVRIADGVFPDKVDNFDKKDVTINVNGKPVKLNITDTAGQERFRTLTSSYFRKAQAMIIVYDIGNEDSFNDLEGYIKEGVRYSERSEKFIVGNKEKRRASDYNQDLFLPWGPQWTSASALQVLLRRDQAQFFAGLHKAAKVGKPELHQHVLVAGIAGVLEGYADWCDVCPSPPTSTSAVTVSGPLRSSWLRENPGRQGLLTGSFHPLDADDWETDLPVSSKEK